jgi:hypothetical protein
LQPKTARLSHEHHRIADPHYPWSADRRPDANLIVMVLHGSRENPQITLEVGLTAGRHDAAERRPRLYDLNAPTHLKSPLKPVILEKILHPRCGCDDNVRTKAARIQLGSVAGQRAQVGERATRQHVNAGRVEEGARRQREGIGQRRRGEPGFTCSTGTSPKTVAGSISA